MDHRASSSSQLAPLASPRIAVVIPALDEEKSIVQVLRAIPKQFTELVIVVDNGSSDCTASLAAAAGARVLKETHRGYGAACLAGVAALPQDVEIVVFLDADYSDYPEEMQELVAPILRNQADFVVGSRMLYPTARAALAPQMQHLLGTGDSSSGGEIGWRPILSGFSLDITTPTSVRSARLVDMH